VKGNSLCELALFSSKNVRFYFVVWLYAVVNRLYDEEGFDF